jgi:CxxC-x17-CxxC domain-containing protein
MNERRKMKKFKQRKTTSKKQSAPEAPMPETSAPGTTELLERIQQKLASLERKIDTLISQPQERHFERKHFSKPFQRFEHSYHHDKRDQDNRSGERSFTRAICADCNKECEVPFKPSGGRPVYCKECFSKRKNGGHGDDTQAFGERKKPIFRRRKEHA